MVMAEQTGFFALRPLFENQLSKTMHNMHIFAQSKSRLGLRQAPAVN
jgi:aspartate/tyrosine/aromatic aminotransferase